MSPTTVKETLLVAIAALRVNIRVDARADYDKSAALGEIRRVERWVVENVKE